MKIIRNILVGIFSVVALVFGLIFYSFSRTIPLKDRQQLSGGAVQVKDGMVSVGLIPSGDGQVMLVDCGNDPKARQFAGFGLKIENGSGDTTAVRRRSS